MIDNFGVSVDSTYDNRNRLDIRTWQGGGVDAVRVDYDYRANGERQTLTRYADAGGSNKIGQTSYEFYRNGLTKGITHTGPTGNVLVDYDYVYDAGGRLQTETHHGKNYVYGYDRTNQLTRVDIDGVLAESFVYDKNGNRITSTGFTPGNYTTGPGNQLLSDGTFRYTYDREGNLKTKTNVADSSVTEYTWDYRNRMLGVEERSAGGIVLKTVQYAYDPTGRRISEIVNGVATLRVVHDGDHAWADFASSGVVTERYLFGQRIDENLATLQATSSVKWLLIDKLGTIRELAGPDGTIFDTMSYSAFGKILSQTDVTSTNRHTYTGRESTPNDDLYYYRERFYSREFGRFISRDPISFAAGDGNLYRYVNNSVTDYTDPLGLLAIIEYGGISFGVSNGKTGAIGGAGIGYLVGYGVTNLSFLAGYLTTINSKGQADFDTAFDIGLSILNQSFRDAGFATRAIDGDSQGFNGGFLNGVSGNGSFSIGFSFAPSPDSIPDEVRRFLLNRVEAFGLRQYLTGPLNVAFNGGKNAGGFRNGVGAALASLANMRR